jgi:uncharacterized membrane protein
LEVPVSRPFGDLYNVLLLLHILTVVVAFAPAVVNPIYAAQMKGEGEGVLQRFAGHMAANGRRIHFPALIATGAFGLGMVFSSKPDGSDENFFGFDQAWVSLALLLWIALCGVISAVILPAERKLACGDAEAEKKVAMGGQIATLLFLVMLYLMIWKPGL